VSPTTGERRESVPSFSVPANLVSWSVDTTEELQQRTCEILDKKMNFLVNTNSILDQCFDEIDDQKFSDQQEYETALVRLMVEKYVDVLSKLTGQDPSTMLEKITLQMLQQEKFTEDS